MDNKILGSATLQPALQLRTKVSELDNDKEFAYITYVVLSLICGLTFLVLLYITIKVIKKVGTTDKIIPAMLIMLQLSAISKFQ